MQTVSIIVPVYNEEKNISPLLAKLYALNLTNIKSEFILINDGSTDQTEQQILKHKNNSSRLISFTRNFGQTAALAAGFDAAKGEIIIALDGDLQNDPADIPKLIKKIREGYDVVSGWRKKRHDNISRVIPSQIANFFISLISGVKLHDYGCTLKAYRKEFIQGFKLYGEMHRFIPIYAYWQGARITEIEVNHFPRKLGISKYGFNRIFKVILDLLTIKFLGSYSTKPIYFFGGFGSFLCLGGSLTFLVTIYEKIVLKAWVHRNPLFMVSIFLVLAGIQFLFFGVLAEILVRTYYAASQQKIYRIKQ